MKYDFLLRAVEHPYFLIYVKIHGGPKRTVFKRLRLLCMVTQKGVSFSVF